MRDVCLARKQFSCWAPEGGVQNHLTLGAHADGLREGKRPEEMRRAFNIAHALLGETPDVSNGGRV